jgi:hypothetical protein
MLTIQARPYILIVAADGKCAHATDHPVCMGSEHARLLLDQITEQMKKDRKKLKMTQEFVVMLWRIPT